MGHPERRVQEAARHGLEGVIAPPGSGPGASEAPTLRQALALAIGPPDAAPERSEEGLHDARRIAA